MFILALILSLLMLLVIYFDVTRYIIPNWLVGVVLVFYPAALLFSPVTIDWPVALVAFGIFFAIGFLLFISNIMGGGDVKLLAACCLWTGTAALIPYLLYTSLLGGALSVLLMAGRPLLQYYATRLRPGKPLPRVLSQGEPAPYGVAIAGGFLLVLWMQTMPGIRW